MSAAVTIIAGLAAYLGVLGIDWFDDTASPIMRGLAAAAVLDLAAISLAAGIWTVVT